MDQSTQTPADETQIDQRYNVVVAFLLVLILACLSTLWLRERNRRIEFEARATQLVRENLQLRATVEQLILNRPAVQGGDARKAWPPAQAETAPASQPTTDRGQ